MWHVYSIMENDSSTVEDLESVAINPPFVDP